MSSSVYGLYYRYFEDPAGKYDILKLKINHLIYFIKIFVRRPRRLNTALKIDNVARFF